MFQAFSFRLGALFAFGALAYTATSPVAAAITREFDETFPASANHELLIDASQAEIRVTGSDRSDIALHMVWTAKTNSDEKAETLFENLRLEPKTEANRTALKLVAKKQGGWFFRRASKVPEVLMELQVPRDVTLRLDVTSGEIVVREVAGRHRIDTTSAAVTLEASPGDHVIDTTSGQITLLGCPGNHRLDSTSGTIRVDGGAGDIVADTVSGSIQIHNFPGAHQADSVSGSIHASLGSTLNRDLSFDTISGSIHLSVPADLAAEYKLESVSGGLHFEVPEGEIIRQTRRELEAKVGADPAHHIQLDTVSGGITVKRAEATL